jgi:hypothetical protein
VYQLLRLFGAIDVVQIIKERLVSHHEVSGVTGPESIFGLITAIINLV